jgi:hypothetical protein
VNRPGLHDLESQLASARLQYARMEAGRRIGRVHTDEDVAAAAKRVEEIQAQVATARGHLRQQLAGDANRLLSDVQGALEAVHGIGKVLERIAQDLRAVLGGAG